jgi:hypothetical protein
LCASVSPEYCSASSVVGGVGLDLVDLLRHAVERLEGRGVLQAAHRLLDGLLRLGALLPRDEDVLLALGLFDLRVEELERRLELVDRLLLLLPLILERGGELVVLLLAAEGLLGEDVVAGLDREHRASLPLGGVRGLLLGLLREALLVGDRDGDLLLRLDQLVGHVDDDLVQHLLGVFRAADEVVQVRFDEGREAREDAHDDCSSVSFRPGRAAPRCGGRARGRCR